jgi:hypothetical protein
VEKKSKKKKKSYSEEIKRISSNKSTVFVRNRPQSDRLVRLLLLAAPLDVVVEANHPERFGTNNGDELEHGWVSSWESLVHLTVVSLESVVGAIDHVIRHDTSTRCHGTDVPQGGVVLLHPHLYEVGPELVELGAVDTLVELGANESNCSRYVVDRDEREQVDEAVLVHQLRDEVLVDV